MTEATAVASPPVHQRLNRVLETYKKWLYIPDDVALLTVLAVVAANLRLGDPVWLLVIAPPGGGKTEVLQGLGSLPYVHPAATLTEPALLSGTSVKERAAGAKGGLLRQIGGFGIILCKDFGSVLSMHRDARGQVLAALREVYDGSWTRHVGTSGGQSLHWQGKVGFVAGCTPTIDRHHAVMGAMGERFILLRLPELDGDEQARMALAHAGREREMRAEMTDAIAGLYGDQPDAKALAPAGDLTDTDRERLMSLATLVVHCRSAVERDSYTREIELVPGTEAPSRLVVVLSRLLLGLDAIGVPRERGWQVLTRTALDSMPALRRAVLEHLYQRQHEAPSTTAIATDVRYPTQTTRRALEDLHAHTVVTRTTQGQGQADLWTLEPWTRARYNAALHGTVPEKSHASPYTTRNSLPTTNYVRGDISGTPSSNGARAPEELEWH